MGKQIASDYLLPDVFWLGWRWAILECYVTLGVAGLDSNRCIFTHSYPMTSD